MKGRRGYLVVEVTEECAEGPQYWAALRALNDVAAQLQLELDRAGGPGERQVGPLDRILEMNSGQWHWRLALAIPDAGFEIARHLAVQRTLRFDATLVAHDATGARG
jgi:hypothetical protein